MTQRIAAIVWSATGIRMARGLWRSGRVEDVTVERAAHADLAALGTPIDRDTMLAIVLPSTEAGRRIVTLPFRGHRALEDVVALETRGALPIDPGPLRVVWEALPESHRDSTRVATVFARESTLTTIGECLARAGLSALRIDAAPIPVWSLVDDPHATAVLVRDPDGTWVTAVARDRRPLFARPLHADPDDDRALAAEVAHTLREWGIEPDRILVAGRGANANHDALVEACATPCEALAPPAALAGALENDPLLAGALLAVARRIDLPLALVAPAAVPRQRRRRLARLAAAAAVLAVLHGALTRMDLTRRAEALEAGIAAVVADALPNAAPGTPYEQLEAVATALPTGPPTDPAIVRLHEVLSHLPPALVLDLRRLRVDPDHVQLGGNVATFDAVETLRSALERSSRIVDVTIAEMRSRLDGVGVEFRIEARWLSPGEHAS